MSEPIVFVSHHRVKPVKLDQLKSLTREIWATVEMEKPRTLMNLPTSTRRDRGHVRTLSPTSRPCSSTGLGADDRTALAYVYIEPIGLEIYGPAEERSSAGCAPKRQVLAQR